MSKEKKFRNKSFIQLPPDLIESDAYRDLSGKAAVTCLFRFHQKAYKKRKSTKKRGMRDLIITNNGEIIFTYAEAKELGIRSTQTFYKVIRELVEDKGFIDITEPGNWYAQQPTFYAISERWKRYGTTAYEAKKMDRSLPPGLGFEKQKPL